VGIEGFCKGEKSDTILNRRSFQQLLVVVRCINLGPAGGIAAVMEISATRTMQESGTVLLQRLCQTPLKCSRTASLLSSSEEAATGNLQCLRLSRYHDHGSEAKIIRLTGSEKKYCRSECNALAQLRVFHTRQRTRSTVARCMEDFSYIHQYAVSAEMSGQYEPK
jgi:hypothetical protein